MAHAIVLVISQKMIADKLTAAGLDDAQVFEAVRFADVDDLISSLFPGITAALEPDAEDHAKVLLVTAASRAAFSRRVEEDGLPGGLSDTLWDANAARERAREKELAESAVPSVGSLGKGPSGKRDRGRSLGGPRRRPSRPGASLRRTWRLQ